MVAAGYKAPDEVAISLPGPSGKAALDMRKQASLAAVIGQRALLSIAANAKRRG